MTFTFNSRDSYKAYKAQWSREYQDLSVKIREAKMAVRVSNRAFSLARSPRYLNEIHDAYSDLRMLKKYIKEALDSRAASKIEAQRQYLMSKV